MTVRVSDVISGPVSYADLREEAGKPLSQRKSILGRDGEKKQIRLYHLSAEKKAELIASGAATGGVINPLKGRVGAYWGQVEALILLGANEYHSLKAIKDKMREIMGVLSKKRKVGQDVVETDAWTDFQGKGARTGAAKPKDVLGRIEQNFRVLQRLPRVGKEEKNPYGLKLAQFGMCIDIEYRDVGSGVVLPFIRLNTGWACDEDGTKIEPLYANPHRKKRGRAKTEDSGEKIEIVGGIEVKQEIETISVTEESSGIEVGEENEEAMEEVREMLGLPAGVSNQAYADELPDGIVLPPDDFDEQIREG
jgi:hypothetical protein